MIRHTLMRHASDTNVEHSLRMYFIKHGIDFTSDAIVFAKSMRAVICSRSEQETTNIIKALQVSIGVTPIPLEMVVSVLLEQYIHMCFYDSPELRAISMLYFT